LIGSDTTPAGQTYTAAAVSPSVQGDVWVGDFITSASGICNFALKHGLPLQMPHQWVVL